MCVCALVWMLVACTLAGVGAGVDAPTLSVAFTVARGCVLASGMLVSVAFAVARGCVLASGMLVSVSVRSRPGMFPCLVKNSKITL